MRLVVTSQGYDTKGTIYDIAPEKRSKRNRERLDILAHRIEAVAKRILGKRFKSFEQLSSGYWILTVKKGTSKNGKSKLIFRDLIGWVCLFDEEPAAR